MTDWTARIDALLYGQLLPAYQSDDDLSQWLLARLSLAAERLREPHAASCSPGWHAIVTTTENPTGWRHRECTCGKDSDMKRILEGDK